MSTVTMIYGVPSKEANIVPFLSNEILWLK